MIDGCGSGRISQILRATIAVNVVPTADSDSVCHRGRADRQAGQASLIGDFELRPSQKE